MSVGVVMAAPPSDHKFTGQKLDASTGLYYYNARYYDPVVGHFVSPDTLVPDPTSVWDYNRFGYARLNPLKYNDPTGHASGPMVHDSNAGLPTLLSYESFFHIQADYYNLSVAYADLPSDVQQTLDLYKQTYGSTEVGYVDMGPGATNQAGTVRDPAVLGASLVGGGRIILRSPQLVRWFIAPACGDGDCTNEARNSYAIGEEGAQRVWRTLNDPTLQTEVRVYVQEAGRRANYFARLDGLTRTAIHEVKNVERLSLSQDFMNQATIYKRIADSMGLELHYWLVNSAPPKVVTWLQQQGIIVHTNIQ